jgi:ankyrin repeat protein
MKEVKEVKEIYNELFEAVKNGDKAKVVDLIDKGVDINAKDIKGKNLLHWAIWKDQEEIAKLQIKKGCNGLNTKDNAGNIPLDYASRAVSESLQNVTL